MKGLKYLKGLKLLLLIPAIPAFVCLIGCNQYGEGLLVKKGEINDTSYVHSLSVTVIPDPYNLLDSQKIVIVETPNGSRLEDLNQQMIEGKSRIKYLKRQNWVKTSDEERRTHNLDFEVGINNDTIAENLGSLEGNSFPNQAGNADYGDF